MKRLFDATMNIKLITISFDGRRYRTNQNFESSYHRLFRTNEAILVNHDVSKLLKTGVSPTCNQSVDVE